MVTHATAYRLAIHFYLECESLTLPAPYKTNLAGASCEILQCLFSANCKTTPGGRLRRYELALDALEVCRSVLELHPQRISVLHQDLAELLELHLLRLTQPPEIPAHAL